MIFIRKSSALIIIYKSLWFSELWPLVTGLSLLDTDQRSDKFTYLSEKIGRVQTLACNPLFTEDSEPQVEKRPPSPVLMAIDALPCKQLVAVVLNIAWKYPWMCQSRALPFTRLNCFCYRGTHHLAMSITPRKQYM